MPVARQNYQRRVRRGTWKTRFTKQRVNWRGTSKFAKPTLTSISPTTAEIGAADLTLTCTGTGFVVGITRIIFNGGYESTTVVSPTSCTTVVKPSLAGAAIAVPVEVANGPLQSGTPQTFTFTEPEEP